MNVIINLLHNHFRLKLKHFVMKVIAVMDIVSI